MPTLILQNRRRRIRRGRPRLNAPGNFITIRRGSMLYSLTFPPTPEHYVKYQAYAHPYPKAYGYIDAPPLVPPLVLIGPAANPEQIEYPAAPPEIPPPPALPAERRATGPPFEPGDSGSFAPGTSPSRLVAGSFPIARLTLLAAGANTGKIWVAYKVGAAAEMSFPLAAGAARDFEINDLSLVSFVAENATDKFYFIYER